MKQYLMFEQNPVFGQRDNMQIVKFDISKCTCGIKKGQGHQNQHL